MEVVNEWTTTDIELKTDTAAVLECLQRSMADEEDDDFILYSHPSNSELVSSLPPVSELKADLSTYYADRGRANDIPFEERAPDIYGASGQYENSTAYGFTAAASQFTTLTNASSNNNAVSVSNNVGLQSQSNESGPLTYQPQYYADPPPYNNYQGSGDCYRDAYTPSGRQSTSFIPSDLQQVTPTIQDLGASIPPTPQTQVPVSVAPISNLASSSIAYSNSRNVFAPQQRQQQQQQQRQQQPNLQDIGGGLGNFVEKQVPSVNTASYSQQEMSNLCDTVRGCSTIPPTQQTYSQTSYPHQTQVQDITYQCGTSRSTFDAYQECQYNTYQNSNSYCSQDATSSSMQAATSATQMLHDALEYIAPEVVTEHRDSLFNPISALTNTLLENNFDVQPGDGYGYRYEEGVQESDAQGVPRQETRKRDIPKLLEIIKVYRCKACGFRSSDKLKALRHAIESHSRPKLNRKARYACGSCHNHYATLEACGKHIGKKHSGLNTAVLKDGKLFKEVLVEPKRRSRVRPDESSAQKIAWKRKLKRDQGHLVCQFRGCGHRFRAEDTHRYHLRCHLAHPSEEERFRCPLPNCKQGSKLWPTLANHLWNAHHMDIELQSCNRCDFKTYSLSNLEKVHKLVHSEEKQFDCDECQSKFRTIKQLRNHQYYSHSETTQTEEYRKSRMACCPQCGREILKKNLGSHLRKVHQRQIPEKSCPHCDFKTTVVSQLRAHIKFHIGVRAMFCCEQCGFLTADHNVHRKHLAQHTGEKPYKCRWCSYASIQASTYKQHVKKLHPEKAAELILRCPRCTFETISEARLKQHDVKCLPPDR
ncbi:zinc finger protein 555 [Galendromus occidentalis]|uniref:Zinc finger protein 555 n=1 Tax=Galendromus occidentalis TaxID=34638 RepID=A0AAJ7WIW2_9ACAR|nr:zinc finger protein 555 [Galendromus occidentalis]